jgi:anti-sigma regulatory factor (Ser/Thr protein kinase)
LKTISIASHCDYSELFEICKSGYNDNDLIIDISKLGFINTYDVLLIVQSVIFIYSFNSEINIRIKAHSAARMYLEDIGLFEFISKNHKQSQTINFIKSQTAMPIRRIDVGHIEEYVIETIKYIGYFCQKKDLTILSVGIKEAINNVYDHSKSTIGAYVFCQYLPKDNRIKVCVSDMGIGIPNNVRKTQPYFSDLECLKWAVIRNHTTKSTEQNAGYGLANIVDFVKANRGRLRILSDTGSYELIKGRESVKNNSISNFMGTLIDFDIIVNNLEEEDSLDTSNF